MTIYEFLKENRETINTMLINGIDPSDLRMLGLVDEYKKMKNAGHKTIYVVAFLADKHHISERKVYRIVKQLGRTL